MKQTYLILLLCTILAFSAAAQETGTNDFRVSNMNIDGNASFDAYNTDIAYNSTNNQYLVVWSGDAITDGENEIWGQILNAADGTEIGSDFRISDMGIDGDNTFRAYSPSVTYNATNNEYLVVWEGSDNIGGLVWSESEVFGQRVSAAGAELGSNDFRISDVGGTNNSGDASGPKVTWNSTDNQYLVIWTADDWEFGTLGFEYEVYGQLLNSTCTEIGVDFQISDMYGIGVDAGPDAKTPDVAYNSTNNEYLVVWSGSEDLIDDYEIYAQRLSSAGAEIGTNDYVISDMGPAGDANYDAENPSICYNATNNEYLVVWKGDDNTAPLVSGEYEVHGQRLSNTGTEIGTNDFRISDMGDDSEGNSTIRDNYAAYYPDVAWNSTNNDYFVVWYGDDNTAILNDNENEVWGQLVSNTGTIVESEQRISDSGNDGNGNFDTYEAAIAVGPGSNYTIVWHGEDNQGSVIDGEYEIWGQIIDASQTNNNPRDIFSDPSTVDDGTTSGVKVSDLWALDMDIDDSFTYTLVAGSGDTDNGSFTISGTDLMSNTTFDYATKDTYYIRVNVFDGIANFATELIITVKEPVTTLVGSNITITSVGTASNSSQDAWYPNIAYNSTNEEFMVVYRADHNFDTKEEVFAQRVNTSNGSNIGSQIQISSHVPGNISFDVSSPAIAYNSTDNQYLVIWHGEDNISGLIDGENEIWGQFINASSGALIRSNFRISDAGGTGFDLIDAIDPDIAYNATDNEFLVVWRSDDTDNVTIIDNEQEIWGQRISNTGAQLGTNDFRISDMGTNGNSAHIANDPDISWSATDNKYLVVWDGDDVDGVNQAYGQFISNTGTEIGVNDFLISNVPPLADADEVGVAYNSTDNEFLVVWDSDTDTDGKNTAYGQIINSATNSLSGSNFLISNQEPGNPNYDDTDVEVAYNQDANEYLVVWRGESTMDGMVDGEFEIFAQRIDSDGSEIEGDERISENGGTGNNSYDAYYPSAAYSPSSRNMLIVWYGDDDTLPLVDNENEIWGQLWKVPVSCTEPDVPTISASPTSVCSGGTSTLTITGNLNDATDWQVYTTSCGGDNIGYTSGSTIDVNPVTTTTYYIRGEGGCTTPASCETVTVTVTSPTSVTTQPNPATTACEGDTDITLSVLGSGTGTITYQWYNTAGVIVGETNANLVIITSPANSDTYYCVIGSDCGADVQTANSVVTINPATQLVTDPAANTNACEGDADITLSVLGSGTGTITYQWYNTAGLIVGETTTDLTITTNPANSDTYYCIIGSDCGADVQTANAIITINPATAVVTDPAASTTACEGDADITLYVLGSGTGTITYQWYNTAGLIVGETTTDLTITTNPANSDTYYCIIGSDCGADVQTANAIITINPATAVVTDPAASTTACEGDADITLYVLGSGTGTITYQWYNTAGLIVGETTTDLTITTNPVNSDTYYCVIGSDCGADVQTANAIVTINPTTALVTDPIANTTVCEGDADVTLSVLGSGTGTITYQWYNTAGLIVGETTTDLTITTNPVNSDTYYCVIGSDCGADVQTADAIVTINPVTALITDPAASTTACEGDADITLYVLGSGGTTHSINMVDYKSGVYFITIIQGNESQSFKVVKK